MTDTLRYNKRRSPAGSRLVGVGVMLILAVTPLAAQTEDGATGTSSVTMGAGDIDVGLSGGLGALVYPFIEPQVAVGLIPIGPVTVSVGVVGDVGYCLLCGILQVANADWSLNSYYYGVYGRVLAHLSVLTDAVGDELRIDPYAGLAVGPRFYTVGVEYTPTGESSRATLNSIIIAPQAGARLFMNESARWFGYAEARYLFEIGFQSTTVDIGGQTYTVGEEYSSGGTNIALGIGLRL